MEMGTPSLGAAAASSLPPPIALHPPAASPAATDEAIIVGSAAATTLVTVSNSPDSADISLSNAAATSYHNEHHNSSAAASSSLSSMTVTPPCCSCKSGCENLRCTCAAAGRACTSCKHRSRCTVTADRLPSALKRAPSGAAASTPPVQNTPTKKRKSAAGTTSLMVNEEENERRQRQNSQQQPDQPSAAAAVSSLSLSSRATRASAERNIHRAETMESEADELIAAFNNTSSEETCILNANDIAKLLSSAEKMKEGAQQLGSMSKRCKEYAKEVATLKAESIRLKRQLTASEAELRVRVSTDKLTSAAATPSATPTKPPVTILQRPTAGVTTVPVPQTVAGRSVTIVSPSRIGTGRLLNFVHESRRELVPAGPTRSERHVQHGESAAGSAGASAAASSTTQSIDESARSQPSDNCCLVVSRLNQRANTHSHTIKSIVWKNMQELGLFRSNDPDSIMPVKAYLINQGPVRLVNAGPIEWKIVFGSPAAVETILSRYHSLPSSSCRSEVSESSMTMRAWMPSRATPLDHPINRQAASMLNRIAQDGIHSQAVEIISPQRTIQADQNAQEARNDNALTHRITQVTNERQEIEPASMNRNNRQPQSMHASYHPSHMHTGPSYSTGPTGYAPGPHPMPYPYPYGMYGPPPPPFSMYPHYHPTGHPPSMPYPPFIQQPAQFAQYGGSAASFPPHSHMPPQ